MLARALGEVGTAGSSFAGESGSLPTFAFALVACTPPPALTEALHAIIPGSLGPAALRGGGGSWGPKTRAVTGFVDQVDGWRTDRKGQKGGAPDKGGTGTHATYAHGVCPEGTGGGVPPNDCKGSGEEGRAVQQSPPPPPPATREQLGNVPPKGRP